MPKNPPTDESKASEEVVETMRANGYNANANLLDAEDPDSDVTNFGGIDESKILNAMVTDVKDRIVEHFTKK